MEQERPKKRKFNKKSIFSSISLVLVILVIFSATFFQAVIDPNYWTTDAFLSSLLTNVALIIVGIVSGVGEADNYYHNLKNGLYQTIYTSYNRVRAKIEPFIDKYTDWNLNYYEKEKEAKILRYLKIDYNIKQAKKILELDRFEIETLVKPQQINGTYYKSLTVEQLGAIFKVLDGKVKVEFMHEGYFLNAFSNDSTVSMYEKARKQEKDKQRKFIGLIGYRVMMTLTVALIFAGLQIDANSDMTAQQMWLNLATRMWTLGNAVAYGFFTSNELIKDECKFLDYKNTVLDKFYLEVIQNKTFNSRSAEDIAREEYEREEQINEREIE